MSDEIYQKLREHLDQLQGPFPATESGVELKILKKLFTPEQARLAMQLKHLPEPPAVIAARAGMPEAEAAEKLELMARQGSLFRLRAGDKVFYYAIPFVVGIYEFHLNSLDRELAELMEEYFPDLRKKWAVSQTKQMRVIPIAEAVPAGVSIAPYQRVRELVESNERFAVAQCICRKEEGLLGRKCNRPQETCLTFGPGADYYIENGLGRKITKEVALKILDMAEENALVLCPGNSQTLTNICCCCSCCCGVLKSLKAQPRPADAIDSAFSAKVAPDLCTACGLCLDRCQMEAIKEGDSFEVDLARCIGCGLCVTTCPAEAITLQPRPTQTTPPLHYIEATLTIMKERGLI
jgi:ferredoxin